MLSGSGPGPVTFKGAYGTTVFYEVSGEAITRLTGAAPSPVQFHGSSPDGIRVFVSTAGPLTGADGDTAQDVHQVMDGVISLLSGGSASCSVPSSLGTCDAGLAGASADGATVLIQTRERRTFSLTCDATTGAYSYVWKTDDASAGTCRQLVMLFKDGDEVRANCSFT